MTTAQQAPHSHGAVIPDASRAEWFTSYDVEAFEVARRHLALCRALVSRPAEVPVQL